MSEHRCNCRLWCVVNAVLILTALAVFIATTRWRANHLPVEQITSLSYQEISR